MSRTACIVAGAPAWDERTDLAALASSCELVIAADGGAARCLDAGVVPDVVVGDFDSLEEPAAEALAEMGVRFEVSSADKDVSDLDLAVTAARARGAEAISVVGVLGGRVDHELAALGTLARAADLRPRIATANGDAEVLSPDGRSTTEVVGPTEFTLMALLAPARVSCAGARWGLTEARLEPISSVGLSNRVSDGVVARVTVHEGVVWLYLP